MEQELWTLTLKGDDIKAYSNRFHELVSMSPELVSTYSKHATLHEAINMARELVEQSVQGRAARIGDKKLPGHMLQFQLKVRFMLEIYQNAIGATYIIMDRVLQSAKDVKE
ncbi:hypothetical protein Tco_0494177 [Tanacetum coccineum]